MGPAPVIAEAAPRHAVDTRGATWRAVYVIWKRDVIRFWRDRSRVIGSLVQPILFLVIFGTGLSSALRGAGGFAGAGLDYRVFMYPGIIAMSVLFTSVFSGMSIVWDREFGFLKEVLVAPIDRSAVAIGKTLGGSTQAVVQGCIILLLAPVVGVRLTPLSVLEMLPLIFCLAFALSGMGVLIASRMTSMQGFMVVINFVLQPLFFLSGALFPLVGLPGWMTVLTRLDPAAYGVDPIRRVVLAGSGVPDRLLERLALDLGGTRLSIPAEAGIMLAFGLLTLGLAVRNFQSRD